ncbi:MAG: SRPBCC family protein [Solirubrobacterales bacterium]
MRIAKNVEIDAPVDQVWEIVGPGFHRVGEWATPVPHSEAKAGEPVHAEAPVAGRTCETTVSSFPALDERLSAYDEKGHSLTYEVVDGLPGFVSDAHNTWKLKPLGTSRTLVTLDGTIETRGIGRVMSPMLRLQLNRAINQSVDDLRIYAETGEISERKQRSLAKLGIGAEPSPASG